MSDESTGLDRDASLKQRIRDALDVFEQYLTDDGRIDATALTRAIRRSSMPTTTIKYFAYDHLPENLQAVSKPIADLAQKLEAELPDGPEKSAGMRKLLEAKDCFVRAALDAPQKPSEV